MSRSWGRCVVLVAWTNEKPPCAPLSSVAVIAWERHGQVEESCFSSWGQDCTSLRLLLRFRDHADGTVRPCAEIFAV